MADVSMNYSSLETAASKITTAKSNLEEVITALTSAVSSLEGNWQGASYEAFRNAWQESKPTMQRLAEAVGNFAPELTKAVGAQREIETSNANRMSSLAF